MARFFNLYLLLALTAAAVFTVHAKRRELDVVRDSLMQEDTEDTEINFVAENSGPPGVIWRYGKPGHWVVYDKASASDLEDKFKRGRTFFILRLRGGENFQIDLSTEGAWKQYKQKTTQNPHPEKLQLERVEDGGVGSAAGADVTLPATLATQEVTGINGRVTLGMWAIQKKFRKADDVSLTGGEATQIWRAVGSPSTEADAVDTLKRHLIQNNGVIHLASGNMELKGIGFDTKPGEVDRSDFNEQRVESPLGVFGIKGHFRKANDDTLTDGEATQIWRAVGSPRTEDAAVHKLKQHLMQNNGFIRLGSGNMELKGIGFEVTTGKVDRKNFNQKLVSVKTSAQVDCLMEAYEKEDGGRLSVSEAKRVWMAVGRPVTDQVISNVRARGVTKKQAVAIDGILVACRLRPCATQCPAT